MKTSDTSNSVLSFSSRITLVVVASLVAFVPSVLKAADNEPPTGFVSLFNGKDFSNWKVPEGDNGHWKVIDGVIDYDAQSESAADKNLWSEREYTDFVLHVDWRIKRRLM